VVPTGLNISGSDAIGVGALIVRNDVRSDVAYLDNAAATAAEIGCRRWNGDDPGTARSAWPKLPAAARSGRARWWPATARR
jgi:hypothetical protein